MNAWNQRNAKLALSLTIVFVVSTSFIAPCVAQTATLNPSGKFSLIWITDTQYLSESYPRYYDSLCRWIVENKDAYNVKMVIHTGDIVEDEFNQTHWANADHAMSQLLDANVPYCWNAGNHDYKATFWIGNQYRAFDPAVVASKPYWVGDKFSGQNTAVAFTFSGKEFLVVNIAYQANETALTWCNQILDTYPNASAIVTAHMYLNTTAGYGAKGHDNVNWAINFKETVLDMHANVFLTLSAHYYPTVGNRTQVGGRHELMFNRQIDDNEMGAASLRILTFNVDSGLIDVKTFVIYANTFLADSNNQFTLETDFYNSAVPELPVWVIAAFATVLPVALVAKKWLRKQPAF